MASPLTHSSIAVLGVLFPEHVNFLALLLGSQLPDFESMISFFSRFMNNKNLISTYLDSEIGPSHSLIGIIVLLPLGALIMTLLNHYFTIYTSTVVMIYSLLLGIVSHILLDIPGHKKLMLFYPFYLPEKNPFLFSMRLGFLEKFYPWRKKEKVKDEFMAEYNWWVFSHIFFFLALALTLYVVLKN